MEKMKMESIDGVQNNVEKIAELFPNCITETLDTEKSTPDQPVYKKAINFKILQQMLSNDIVDGLEPYELTWVGKKSSIIEANRPIRKTLRPYPKESINWDTTENLYIEGDNLEVLKLLQESYLGRVKMVYIDPPYNTGHDFIYPDSFVLENEFYNDETEYLSEDGSINYNRENSTLEPRYHSAWCNLIYPRLLLSRNLLTDDGLIFISINEIEVSNLEKICDEIFGSSNHVATFVWKNKYGPGAFTKGVASLHEYILCYSKSQLFNIEANLSDEEKKKYNKTDDKFSIRGGYITQPLATKSKDDRPNLVYPLIHKGKEIWPDKQWIWEKKRLYKAYENGDVVINEKNGKYSVRFKQYLINENGEMRKGKPLSLITNCFNQDGTKEMEKLLGRGIFDFPKPTELIKYLLSLRVNEKDDKDFIVLDFFSGSSSTADAVMQLNAEDGGHRKFVMVQLPELTKEKSIPYKNGFYNICEIGKERIRKAGELIKNKDPLMTQQLDIGFRDLKLESSCFNEVYYHPNQYSQAMLFDLESNIKMDRTDLDLFFSCILDWGLPLSFPYSTESIGGFKIHNYNDGDLMACFDKNVSEELVREIASRQPMRAVFRDSSFENSPEKINIFEIFKKYMPEDADDITKRVRVI